MSQAHSFHIPVMGIGYTIDTPIKLAHFGIDSVISLIDDMLLEKLRKMYCNLYSKPYVEICEKTEDFRAKRITSYLNLVNQLVNEKVESMKAATQEIVNELRKNFQMLPDTSGIKQEFNKLTAQHFDLTELRNWLKDKLSPGSIDVNIMTKVDRENHIGKDKLPREFNDAHAALRGFAQSELHSSVVLSAGFSPRLYSYIASFGDFFPDETGFIKKKIVLKVSDYRSAMIQGKFLAAKGLWVSEFRIESGLNCGGHAFASDGFLLGPILAEFRDQRTALSAQLYEILCRALSTQGKPVPVNPLSLKLSVQGGVGTAEEHQFLLDHYDVDSVGWGTPFMLVPEVINVDTKSLEKLKNAKEDDLFLSNISPLGVPFNSLKGNSKDIERFANIAKGKPGSNCPKKYAALSTEFTEKTLCTASRTYQTLKIRQLELEELPLEEYQVKYDAIVEKSCICVGLGTAALLVNNLDTSTEGEGVSICPGPNLAYFSQEMSLTDITDHIYGRQNFISRSDRPNMFIKELGLYINYLKARMEEAGNNIQQQKEKYFNAFIENLQDGIEYYNTLLQDFKLAFEDKRQEMIQDLEKSKKSLIQLQLQLIKIPLMEATTSSSI